MCYKIGIGKYSLQMLDSVKIVKSVENLSDTAVIVVPGAYINRSLRIEEKIKVGDAVKIELGYDDNLVTEFTGYLNSISTDEASMKLECEDSLWLLRTSLKDRELKSISLKSLLESVLNEVGGGLKLDCNYEFTWDKFTIFRATAIDVLKKIHEETRANIYFKDNTLHIHPVYSEIANARPVVFDFTVNVEKSDLKYVRAEDKKVEVEVTATKPDGTTQKVKHGTTGGTVIRKTAGTTDETGMKRIAESEYSLWTYDGFEGGFTGWLIPYAEPTYKVEIRDKDYPDKNGKYYVIATETSFGASGGSRKIMLGRKIGD